MISGFFDIIPRDIREVTYANQKRLYKSDDARARTTLAAIRLFSTTVMVSSIVLGFVAIAILPTSPVGAIFLLAFSIATWVLARDIFQMAKNLTAITDSCDPKSIVGGFWEAVETSYDQLVNDDEIDVRQVATSTIRNKVLLPKFITYPIEKKILSIKFPKLN